MLKMKRTLTFLGIALLCASSCGQPSADETTVQAPLTAAPADSNDSNDSSDPSHSGGGSSCSSSSCMADPKVVGTWDVTNYGLNKTGRVTFKADHTYTIDSGYYAAGGSWISATSGTYKMLPGGAIMFTYNGPMNYSRIAVVRCTTADRILHFTMGHTHDYEELKRARP